MSFQLTPIGRTNKTHGVDGTLRITIKAIFLEDFVNAEVVFLETGGQPTPYFIEDRWGSDPLFLRFEEIDNKEKAKPLTNKVLSLRAQDIQVPASDQREEVSYAFAKWQHYKISDQTHGDIGNIIDVVEYPQQILAVVQFKGQEIMIPLHGDLIVEVLDKEKIVVMDLPEGLLEL